MLIESRWITATPPPLVWSGLYMDNSITRCWVIFVHRKVIHFDPRFGQYQEGQDVISNNAVDKLCLIDQAYIIIVKLLGLLPE